MSLSAKDVQWPPPKGWALVDRDVALGLSGPDLRRYMALVAPAQTYEEWSRLSASFVPSPPKSRRSASRRARRKSS